MRSPVEVLSISDKNEREPYYAEAEGLDLVVVLDHGKASVLYGRCHHRGALLADGHIDGKNLICGLHGWDYRYDTGISEYNNDEALHKFSAEIRDDKVIIDLDEVKAFLKENPQPFNRESYLGKYADTHPEDTEPHTSYITELARNGLKKSGHHGPSGAMGVDRNTLPGWDHIQYLTAQLWKKPLEDDADVNTETIIGPSAAKPLHLSMPLFVSDMSFGALSREAKVALAKGAQMAGTGICSGEGGMLPAEQEQNSKYFYELASGEFGFEWEKLQHVQAFHFKGGQGAKSGTGGHLPGDKVTEEIAGVRGLKKGQAAISPATFRNLKTSSDFREFGEEVRKRTGGTSTGESSNFLEDFSEILKINVPY